MGSKILLNLDVSTGARSSVRQRKTLRLNDACASTRNLLLVTTTDASLEVTCQPQTTWTNFQNTPSTQTNTALGIFLPIYTTDTCSIEHWSQSYTTAFLVIPNPGSLRRALSRDERINWPRESDLQAAYFTFHLVSRRVV